MRRNGGNSDFAFSLSGPESDYSTDYSPHHSQDYSPHYGRLSEVSGVDYQDYRGEARHEVLEDYQGQEDYIEHEDYREHEDYQLHEAFQGHQDFHGHQDFIQDNYQAFF